MAFQSVYSSIIVNRCSEGFFKFQSIFKGAIIDVPGPAKMLKGRLYLNGGTTI